MDKRNDENIIEIYKNKNENTYLKIYFLGCSVFVGNMK